MCHRALIERGAVVCLALVIACAVQENTAEPPAGQSSVGGAKDASGGSSTAGATFGGTSGNAGRTAGEQPGAGGQIAGAEGDGSDNAGSGGAAGGDGSGSDNAGSGGAAACVASNVVLTPVADADIRADSATANSGATGDFQVRRFGASNSWRGVVTFDLSAIPSAADVVSAQLVLTVVGVSGVASNVAVHRVEPMAEPWDEMHVTWQAAGQDSAWVVPGGDFEGSPSAVAAIVASAQAAAQVTWDVTADAASFVSAPSGNRGWIVKDQDEPVGGSGELVAFAARNHADPSWRPKLQVTYCH